MTMALVKSEDAARHLGVWLEKRDKTDRRNAAGRRLWFYKFRRGHDVLKVMWHTKAGAWQAALRWAKKLLRGELK